MEERVKLRLGKLEAPGIEALDVEATLGPILEEVAEPEGPTPFPSVTDLREWDFRLLKRYKPFYAPLCDLCCLCTFGKCDLTRGKRGACGIDIETQQGRLAALVACMGAAAHAGHARHLLKRLIRKFGPDAAIEVGTEIEAPLTRLICGIRPTRIRDFEGILDYIEEQITHVLSSICTGQEGDSLDYESKALHIGMVDNLALEVADSIQVSTLGFPKADPASPLVEIGLGALDLKKPVVLCIGHNVAAGVEIIGYLKKTGLLDKVEVGGLCCTGHDLARHHKGAKIIGPISRQIPFVRLGVADAIVLDEQCIRTDLLQEARRVHAPVIVTTDKVCLGLPNRTYDQPGVTVGDLVEGRIPGALILDPEKAAEVAVRVAIEIAPKRRKFKTIPSKSEAIELAKKCNQCGLCRRHCPNDLPIPDAVKKASKGDLQGLLDLFDYCVACLRCERACEVGVPVASLIQKAAEAELKRERYKIRAGRGPVQDIEIRRVGAPIVLGETPGIIAFVGCPNYARGAREVAEMCEEFLRRRYIVVASGCAAMSIAMAGEKSLYERYAGDIDAGCLANVGACVANAHIIGAVVKIANIFARRPLRANFEEIADYVLNRVGACAIAWGAMSQKASAIATGANRLGIPVIVGPHGAKYRRFYLGRKDLAENWFVYDAGTGNRVFVGPVPEHLFCVAESKEEAVVLAVKLCMRPNDTSKGRAIKIAHYVDLHKRFFGTLPDDLHLFVRTEFDIPITIKDEVMAFLRKKKWEPTAIPDPTLLERLVRVRLS